VIAGVFNYVQFVKKPIQV